MVPEQLYSNRGARSVIRGGGGGGRNYPQERPLQQVGTRDSRYYGGNGAQQRGGDTRGYREGYRSNNGASSERRRIVYQAKDLKSLLSKANLPNSQASSEPVPIKLDDQNGVTH